MFARCWWNTGMETAVANINKHEVAVFMLSPSVKLVNF